MEPTRTSSAVLTEKIPEIMSRWEARALKEVDAAFGQPSLILRDSLPNLLRSLGVLLSRKERTQIQVGIDAAELLKCSKNHGRGRAELPTYVMSQVIVEYQILRQVLFGVLEENSPLTIADRELLTSKIEEAVNVAATEFALTLREIQDQFMLAIAHDLKSPIAAAQTGAELILRSPKPEITAPLAASMIKSMKKMSEMIEDIHDTSRIESGHGLTIPLSDCDLEEIARDVVGDMQLVYGDCFSIQSDGPIHGLWHPEYLRRLIENILNNAVKYRHGGTGITVTLRRNDGNAELAVHNLGDPISAADQAQLFSTIRWKKSGKSLKGWGLGMALAKGIVDAFRGSIRVESTETAGTTFTVTLPRPADAARSGRKAG